MDRYFGYIRTLLCCDRVFWLGGKSDFNAFSHLPRRNGVVGGSFLQNTDIFISGFQQFSFFTGTETGFLFWFDWFWFYAEKIVLLNSNGKKIMVIVVKLFITRITCNKITFAFNEFLSVVEFEETPVILRSFKSRVIAKKLCKSFSAYLQPDPLSKIPSRYYSFSIKNCLNSWHFRTREYLENFLLSKNDKLAR